MLFVTHSELQRWRACGEQVAVAKRLYPDGIPVTYEAAQRLRAAKCDPLWGLLHLLSTKQRRAFIVFTLKQRHPHLVALLKAAGLARHAEAVAAMDWGDLEHGQQVYERAWAAATAAAAWDAARSAWGAWRIARSTEAGAWAAWHIARSTEAGAWTASRAAGATYDEQVRWCLAALDEVKLPEGGR